MYRLLVVMPAIAVACKNADPPASSAGSAATPIASDSCGKAIAKGPLAWIEDDFPAAIACAKARDVPLVVDLRAPWCHTCLSMQTTVFVDPSFAADARTFVFVALDTDREGNAEALTKLAISAWPTFYVLGPDEAVLARFVGSSSAAEFHDFLAAGARARTGGQPAADARLLGAERALAAKDLATGEQELVAAIAAAPDTWPRRAEALDSLILTKSRRDDAAGCLDVAEKYLDAIGTGAPASDFLGVATTCAATRAKAEPDRVRALRERVLAHWTALLADPKASLSIDDRSDSMASERELLDALGRGSDAKALAAQQLALLDDAAAKAPTPLAAMTYNWPRSEVYAYLERPLDLVPALEKSAAELPGEYDPPARLGWIYFKAGKLAEAAKWTDTALAMVYGPRKARLLGTRADIAGKLGDRAGEKRYRAAVVELWATLPPGQANADALAAAKAALAALDAPAGSAATN